MRYLTLAFVLLVTAIRPAPAKDFVPTPQMAGQGLQCGKAKIIVNAEGKLEVTGLAYGALKITTKDDQIFLEGVPCTPIYCPGVPKGVQC